MIWNPKVFRQAMSEGIKQIHSLQKNKNLEEPRMVRITRYKSFLDDSGKTYGTNPLQTKSRI